MATFPSALRRLRSRAGVFAEFVAIAAAGSTIIGSLAAQSWQLPRRGVAFYERDRVVAGAGAAGFAEVEMPPVLLAGELDRRKTHVVLAPADVRDLGMWLAFDLRIRKRKFTYEVATIPAVGNLVLAGVGSAMKADGVQTITATVSRSKTVPGAFGRGPRGGNGAQVTGTIEIERTFDRHKGTVRQFKAVFRARVKVGANAPGGFGGFPGARGTQARAGAFTVTDRWTLDRVERNREPAFQTRVAQAIRRGVEYVKGVMERGMVGGPRVNKLGVDSGSGTLALCLLTLLKSDVAKDDKVVVRGFKRLRRRKLRDTYSLGVALMAMEALYAPKDERRLLIEGRIKAPLPRKVSVADLALMKEWTSKLLENFDVRERPAYLLRFNYVSGVPRYDNSNTQYALLGLYSAHLCGVSISMTSWWANAQHWLKDQRAATKVPVRLTTRSHAQYQKIRDAQRAAVANGGAGSRTVGGGSRRTVSNGTTKAAGWPYVGSFGSPRGNTPGGGRGGRGAGRRSGAPATASMTTAGLTGVTICQAVFGIAKKGGNLIGKLEKSKRAGLAWMLHDFSVRINKNNGRHFYYYLYGLERACEINQIALLGDRDWYFEGANILIENQNRGDVDRIARGGNRSRGGVGGGRGAGRRGGMGAGRDAGMRGPGAFRGAGLPQTCMAILFLKQSAPPLPVITGRR